MAKSKGSSTNAAPSALNAQAQSETGSLPTKQADHSSVQPSTDATTVQASQHTSTVENSQIQADAQEKQVEQSTASHDSKEGDAALAAKTDTDDQSSQSNEASTALNDQSPAAATDTEINDQTDSDGNADGGNNPPDINQSTADSMPPPEPKVWILRVHNLTGCRLYEPHSNIWLEAHQITEIESKTVKHHQQVTANVQELSRLKRGRVEIIND